jgi:riboflavin synthase
MFTGLIQKLGVVVSLSREEWGARLVISCTEWDLPIVKGESIAVSGCCLTAVESSSKSDDLHISFDVVPETLRCTTLGSLFDGSMVNLERAMKADSFLGGHFVQGHVDGVEAILSSTLEDSGECRLRFGMCVVDSEAMISKGSVTIDGVSLTIASVGDGWFEVALVPTTLEETTLGNASVDDKVNVETDMLTRTVVQVVRSMNDS